MEELKRRLPTKRFKSLAATEAQDKQERPLSTYNITVQHKKLGEKNAHTGRHRNPIKKANSTISEVALTKEIMRQLKSMAGK